MAVKYHNRTFITSCINKVTSESGENLSDSVWSDSSLCFLIFLTLEEGEVQLMGCNCGNDRASIDIQIQMHLEIVYFTSLSHAFLKISTIINV